MLGCWAYLFLLTKNWLKNWQLLNALIPKLHLLPNVHLCPRVHCKSRRTVSQIRLCPRVLTFRTGSLRPGQHARSSNTTTCVDRR